MNSREPARAAFSPITIQALPDGSDNISGLLTALLHNVSTEEMRSHQWTRSSRRRAGSASCKTTPFSPQSKPSLFAIHRRFGRSEKSQNTSELVDLAPSDHPA